MRVEGKAWLRAAVRKLERTRRKGSGSKRWNLVDQFETDDKRFVVAYRCELRLQGLALLTERECQVLRHAALGETNKVIAYELAVTASTVAVLLHRAARKLGTRTHAELLAVFAQLTKAESP